MLKEYIVSQVRERLHLDSTAWSCLEKYAIGFLLQQWALGFPESIHRMMFRHRDGFTGASEVQSGNIFQRALLADIFCDLNELSCQALKPVLSHEVTFLINSQRKTGIGGWSYFPDLPELPPDADDLGQVMQVLVRTENKDQIEACCYPSLTALLTENAYSDGSFDTWIVPRNNRSPEQERQFLFVQHAWGEGREVEVMANLLYALYLFDREKFHVTIENGTGYIKRRQHKSGAWESTWYAGCYYSTYACLRLISCWCPEWEGATKAARFILSAQNHDGGWGTGQKSDTISTALALLSLRLLHDTGAWSDGWQFQLNNSLRFLESMRCEDNCWGDDPFFRMPMERASHKQGEILYFGSRTITTAYVLKALLAWRDRF